MFTINYATNDDIVLIMSIMDSCIPLLPNPDWFVGDSEEFFYRHISQSGFILKAVSNRTGEIAAFFTIRYPGMDPDNCGYDLDFTESELMHTAHMETCVVHPDYRGNHLEAVLMAQAIEIIKETDYSYLLGTVHPDNIPSVKSFLQNNFEIRKTLKKYGGKLRHIMYREL